MTEGEKRPAPQLAPLELAALMSLLGQALLREAEKRRK